MIRISPGSDPSAPALTCQPERCTPTDLLADHVVLLGEGGIRYELGPIIVTDADVSSSRLVDASLDRVPQTSVEIKFDRDGTRRLSDATTEAVGAASPANQMAIVVDGRVISAPIVQARIESGSVQITGPRKDMLALASKLDHATNR